MGLQKFRADKAGARQSDGATPWFTHWMGGPSLALVKDAPTPWGRRTVYLTGEADTFFSIPAACTVLGMRVTGYVTTEDRDGRAEYVFRPHTEAFERTNARFLAKIMLRHNKTTESA